MIGGDDLEIFRTLQEAEAELEIYYDENIPPLWVCPIDKEQCTKD